MYFNTLLAAAAIVPALAAPLTRRQEDSSATLSGSLTAPAENSSVQRGVNGLLNVSYTPGAQTSYIDIELLAGGSEEDDDLDSTDIVSGWAPSNGTAAMTASFRLVNDDFDAPTEDDDDGIPCGATAYLRVTEYQTSAGRTQSVRGPRVPITLECASSTGITSTSAAAPSSTQAAGNGDDNEEDGGDGNNEGGGEGDNTEESD